MFREVAGQSCTFLKEKLLVFLLKKYSFDQQLPETYSILLNFLTGTVVLYLNKQEFQTTLI